MNGNVSKEIKEAIVTFREGTLSFLDNLVLLEKKDGLKKNGLIARKSPFLGATCTSDPEEALRMMIEASLYSSMESRHGKVLQATGVACTSHDPSVIHGKVKGADYQKVVILEGGEKVSLPVDHKSGGAWACDASNAGLASKFKKSTQDGMRNTFGKSSTKRADGLVLLSYGSTAVSEGPKNWIQFQGAATWSFLAGGDASFVDDFIDLLNEDADEFADALRRHFQKALDRLLPDFKAKCCKDGRMDWKKVKDLNFGSSEVHFGVNNATNREIVERLLPWEVFPWKRP